MPLTQDRELLHQVVYFAMRPGPVAPSPGAQFHVLAHGEPGKDFAAFGHLCQPGSDDLVGRRSGEIEVAEPRGPGVWPEYARKRVEDGGLSGAVRTDEGDNFALPHTEGNTTNGFDRAVGNFEDPHGGQG